MQSSLEDGGETCLLLDLLCAFMSWVRRVKVIWSRWTVALWIYQLCVAGFLSWHLNPSNGGFSCNSSQWMLCKKEIVTMQTLWWPSPVLGHCILADPKGCLRCGYSFSFASDLMWPSPYMITSHGFVPLLHFRESCHQVCFCFHLTLECLRGSISNSTLHATGACMGVTHVRLHFSDEGFLFLEIQLGFRIQFRNTKLPL